MPHATPPLAATPVAKAAQAAWANYVSTVVLGGTPDQRRWAFDAAMRAERKHWAQTRRAERDQARAKTKALSG